MSHLSYYSELKNAFEEQSNSDNAIKMSAYMRNQFPFYGIKTEPRRSLYKDFLREVKKKKNVDWDLLNRCWEEEHREFQYFVLDYLSKMEKLLNFDDIPQLEKFIRTKQWWDTIDSLSGVIGNIVVRDEKGRRLILRWSEDEDFWVRRVAIIHQLRSKDRTDIDLLEKVIVNNLGSDEFFINKAIGWSLREYSKTDPVWVNDFIERYAGKLNGLSVREGSKYLGISG